VGFDSIEVEWLVPRRVADHRLAVGHLDEIGEPLAVKPVRDTQHAVARFDQRRDGGLRPDALAAEDRDVVVAVDRLEFAVRLR